MRTLTTLTAEPMEAVGSKRAADDSVSNLERSTRTNQPDQKPKPDNHPSSSSSSSSSSGDGGAAAEPLQPDSCPDPEPDRELRFGFIELSGRLRDMEDNVSIKPAFFKPVRKPPLHFIGVFDGHGGAHVSSLCKELMHVLLAEELGLLVAVEIGDEAVTAAVARSFRRMDDVALNSCVCGRVRSFPCGCGRSETESMFVGSTAVVAIVGSKRILVANCGDSRAVLSRGGGAVALSDDHKPDRPDERARVEAAGGRVVYNNGARVSGILAMSRALGDKYLKPIVSCEPEITITERLLQDECLILATDGLWDVLSNVMACNVARQCLEEENTPASSEASGALEDTGGEGENVEVEHPFHPPPRSRCRTAASLLGRLALGRNSGDNISVIVVDLRGG